MGDQQRAPCPACGEMIVAGASVCRFCKTRLGTKGQFVDPKSNCVSCITCPLLVAAIGFALWLAVNIAVPPTPRRAPAPRAQPAAVTSKGG